MVPAVPWTVSALVPQTAAASSSESIDLAVPGSPTSSRPRSPARVTTQRSTRARSPTNFCSIARLLRPALSFLPPLPITKVTTARGVSRQPGGRGPESCAARNSSSAANRSSGGTTCRAGVSVPAVEVLVAGVVVIGGPSCACRSGALRSPGRPRR